MSLHVKDGGVWKVAQPFVKAAGLWKAVRRHYIRDAGVWKLVYTDLTLSPAPQTLFVSGVSSVTQALTASEAVTWTYTKSANVTATLVSGSVNTTISFSLSTTGTSKAGTVYLTATHEGVLYSWTINLDVSGTA